MDSRRADAFGEEVDVDAIGAVLGVGLVTLVLGILGWQDHGWVFSSVERCRRLRPALRRIENDDGRHID